VLLFTSSGGGGENLLPTCVLCHVTLLGNSKTYEKVVLHMTFEGAKSQGRSPVKPARMALEIGRCCITQQSLM
jgi:hypothetical protein